MNERSERSYSEGSVWTIEYLQTKPGKFDDYLTNLKEEWSPLMDAAVEEGMILGYKILVTPPASRDDWNVAIMVEVENMAALDGYRDRLDRLADKLKGMSAGGGSCLDFRDHFGWQMAREITLR